MDVDANRAAFFHFSDDELSCDASHSSSCVVEFIKFFLCFEFIRLIRKF